MGFQISRVCFCSPLLFLCLCLKQKKPVLWTRSLQILELLCSFLREISGLGLKKWDYGSTEICRKAIN